MAMESNMRDCNFRTLKFEQNEMNLLFYDQRFDKKSHASTRVAVRCYQVKARPWSVSR